MYRSLWQGCQRPQPTPRLQSFLSRLRWSTNKAQGTKGSPKTGIAKIAIKCADAEVTAIVDALAQHYPDPKVALNFSTPLELLIATILSAQCTDERVNIVTQGLFKKYRSAKDYAGADVSELEEDIRSTGFFKNKARMIIDCAGKLESDFGGEVPERLELLTTLPGVGRKTASVVLVAAFGIPAIAVDTHVLRVSNRLGLVCNKKEDTIRASPNCIQATSLLCYCHLPSRLLRGSRGQTYRVPPGTYTGRPCSRGLAGWSVWPGMARATFFP
ncbi:endonuclease III [Candidatus Magnetobacterium bavaricum]|uniref:Endonuclease III n=1 Tax=Candidatus Magnetobacterium bavaricum TaxID=29290 RepID=A0A0F3GUZ6_9BACT|nr:endonuclease III [Candidatus Magnetobacterium bavaricum]